MTYEQLAKKIAELTSEQRQQKVRFIEPYDNEAASCLSISAISIIEDYRTNDGERGTVFLCC